MLGDGGAHVGVEVAHGLAGQVFFGVVEGERPLFRRQPRRGQIGGALDLLHPGLGEGHRLAAAVTDAAHDQGVGQPGDAEAHASLRYCLVGLLGQGKAGDVDGIVEHAHRRRRKSAEGTSIESRPRRERRLDQPRQIERAEKTGAIGGQRLFAARIGGVDVFAIVEVVEPVDAVDEHHAGLGIGVRGAHDLVPQIARRHALENRPLELELPGGVFLHGAHEGVGDQHRKVEHTQAPGLPFGLDKGLDIRVVAAHHRHHGAAPRAGAHDGAAHGVPDVHERQRPRGIGADALDQGALGTQRREVVADAAALLQGEGCLLEIVEDARHVVGHVAHDEAVEQGHVALAAGPRNDPPRRQEAEVLQGLVKALFPGLGVVLGRRQRPRHPPPGVGQGLVHRLAVRLLEAVLHVPYLLRYG